MNCDVGRLKDMVVAGHLLLLAAVHWLMRDFPDLKMRPKPLWMTYYADAWAVFIMMVAVGLIWGLRWARWIALGLYAWITIHVASIWVRVLLKEKIAFDWVFAQFTLLTLFLCFPLALLFQRRSKPAEGPQP